MSRGSVVLPLVVEGSFPLVTSFGLGKRGTALQPSGFKETVIPSQLGCLPEGGVVNADSGSGSCWPNMEKTSIKNHMSKFNCHACLFVVLF